MWGPAPRSTSPSDASWSGPSPPPGSVEDYAARLGYSPRTLTRACLAATGRSAKQLADARVVLQAQRLLAHTDLPVAAIGRTLGFTQVTDFGRFFARETGRTPGDFRSAQR
ncbi:helix-turn-helix domain-containing protein [Kitasatospora sp. NPDC051164]|uniref:helix-turn-helix domain-containing protein n=1 Tax=Kitasatospora sp. NPDC051164 TaxID=3364055 RepID=UPI0037B3A384